MSNIFSVIDELKQFLLKPNITHYQKQFASLILLGQQGHWRPLEVLAISPQKKEIKKIIQALANELHATKTLSHHPFSLTPHYQNLLTYCLVNFEHMKLRMNFTKGLNDTNFNIFKSIMKRFDKVLHSTTKFYSGELVLPINQSFDVRLGTSEGECSGYFFEWTRCLLKKMPPFGVQFNKPSFLKPIKYASRLGLKYPELNHLARLTARIAYYQENIPSDLKCISIKCKTFFINPTKIAEDLIGYAQKKPSKIFELAIYRITLLRNIGHAMGFCFIDNAFHFLDVNLLWVKFGCVNDFKHWFAFYFRTMEYQARFYEYTINAYELVTPAKHGKLAQGALLSMKVCSNLIQVPFILLYKTLRIPIIYGAYKLTRYIDDVHPPKEMVVQRRMPYRQLPEDQKRISSRQTTKSDSCSTHHINQLLDIHLVIAQSIHNDCNTRLELAEPLLSYPPLEENKSTKFLSHQPRL